MARPVVVLLLLASVTLTACSTPEPSQDFNVANVNPMVAKRAQPIIINGTGLGSSSGVVTIGGVAADVTSWSDTQVRASVAADTPHAWQDVLVETDAGESATVARFFVGVGYAGEGDELGTFVASLDADSALLLAAGTYNLPASDPNLDFRRNGLYGHGASATIVRTPGYVRWTAGSGQDVVISDVNIEADGLEVSNAGLAVPPTGPRVIAIRNSELVTGSWLRLLADELDAGVLFENVTVNAPTAELHFDAMRGVTVTDSNLSAAIIEIMATEGVISLDDNDVTASVSLDILAKRMNSGVGMITNNRVRATSDEGPTLVIKLENGTCVIDGNAFEVIDTNLDSAVTFKTDCGITSGDAPQVFARNTLTVLGAGTSTSIAQVQFRGGTVDFSGNTITSDYGFRLIPWSTVGGNITDNTLDLGAQGFNVYGTSISVIHMDGGNRISTAALADSSGYGLSASIRTLIVSGDNQFINSGPVSGTAVVLTSAQHAIVEVDLNDAHFQGFRNAFFFNHPGPYMGFEVQARHNFFDFPITTAPQVALLQGVLATEIIDLNDNRWGDNTNAATVRSYISPASNPVVLTRVTTP